MGVVLVVLVVLVVWYVCGGGWGDGLRKRIPRVPKIILPQILADRASLYISGAMPCSGKRQCCE